MFRNNRLLLSAIALLLCLLMYFPVVVTGNEEVKEEHEGGLKGDNVPVPTPEEEQPRDTAVVPEKEEANVLHSTNGAQQADSVATTDTGAVPKVQEEVQDLTNERPQALGVVRATDTDAVPAKTEQVMQDSSTEQPQDLTVDATTDKGAAPADTEEVVQDSTKEQPRALSDDITTATVPVPETEKGNGHLLTSGHPHSFIITLSVDNITEFVKTVPESSWVLMEFYNPWCPHCQKFMPHYEEVAALHNSKPQTKDSVVVANVNCEANKRICGLFESVKIPHLAIGRPWEFEDVIRCGGLSKLLYQNCTNTTGHEPSKEDLERDHAAIQSVLVQQKKTADTVLDWMNTFLHTKVTRLEEKELDEVYAKHGKKRLKYDADGDVVPPYDVKALASNKMDEHDVEKATLMSMSLMYTPGEVDDDKWKAYKDWLDLLAMAHPIKRCRERLQGIAGGKIFWWSKGRAPAEELETVNACGKDSHEHPLRAAPWRSCAGSREGARGFSCGLWMLFHSLAANLPEEGKQAEGAGRAWLQGVVGYVESFFNCDECRTHFMQMVNSEHSGASDVYTKSDAVLWGWMKHNEVNVRLMQEEEEEESGDPHFPKYRWPGPEACPACHNAPDQPTEWDFEAVLHYNLDFYAGANNSEALPAIDDDHPYAHWHNGTKAPKPKVPEPEPEPAPKLSKYTDKYREQRRRMIEEQKAKKSEQRATDGRAQAGTARDSEEFQAKQAEIAARQRAARGADHSAAHRAEAAARGKALSLSPKKKGGGAGAAAARDGTRGAWLEGEPLAREELHLPLDAPAHHWLGLAVAAALLACVLRGWVGISRSGKMGLLQRLFARKCSQRTRGNVLAGAANILMSDAPVLKQV